MTNERIKLFDEHGIGHTILLLHLLARTCQSAAEISALKGRGTPSLLKGGLSHEIATNESKLQSTGSEPSRWYWAHHCPMLASKLHLAKEAITTQTSESFEETHDVIDEPQIFKRPTYKFPFPRLLAQAPNRPCD